MNKYFYSSLFLIFFIDSYCQELRKINPAPQIPLSVFYYHSDSQVYCSSSDDFKSYRIYKNNKWTDIDLNDGIFSSTPDSKLYFIQSNSLSLMDPLSHKAERTILYNFEHTPKYFDFIDNSSFATHYPADKYIFLYKFDNGGVYSKEILYETSDYIKNFKIKRANDTLLYFLVNSNLYRKNLRTNKRKLVEDMVRDFDCYEKNLVIWQLHTIPELKIAPFLFLSKNFGDNFTPGGVHQLAFASLKMDKDAFSFVNDKLELLSLDLSFKEKTRVDISGIMEVLPNLFNNSSCQMDTSTVPMLAPKWINDSAWIMKTKSDDIFKITFSKAIQIKFLAGNQNIGAPQMYFGPAAGSVCRIGFNGIVMISADTGKIWKYVYIPSFQNLSKTQMNDSSVFFLENNKITQYNFINNKRDTSLYTFKPKIRHFGFSDKKTMIIYANTGTYSFDLEGKKLESIAGASPFTNYFNLKKSKRVFAYTDVDIYYSDNFGSAWSKSLIKGFDNFQFFILESPPKVYEISKDEFFMNAIFNDSSVMLSSKDGGKTFIIERGSDRISAAQLNGEIYSLYKDLSFTKTDVNNNNKVLGKYEDFCPPVDLQATDSALFIWNNRGEIFHFITRKAGSVNSIRETFRVTLFPNPLNSNSVLTIGIPATIPGRIEAIELYDIHGKKLEHLNIEYSADSGEYQIRNLPSLSGQLYIIRVKMNGGNTLNQKLFIN